MDSSLALPSTGYVALGKSVSLKDSIPLSVKYIRLNLISITPSLILCPRFEEFLKISYSLIIKHSLSDWAYLRKL